MAPTSLSVVTAARHLTKTELALQELRERIRSGQLPPGRRLRVEELTREFGMSPTPIREALRILQADGLVDYRAHREIVVAELSLAQMSEIFRLRGVLEPLAVELAVPSIGPEKLAQLERLHRQYASAASSKRGTAVAKHNSAWHWAIYECSGSSMLNDFIRRLWEAFPWRTIWALPGRMELSLHQHEKIMEALRAHDAASAAEQMRMHIASGQDTLEEHRLT